MGLTHLHWKETRQAILSLLNGEDRRIVDNDSLKKEALVKVMNVMTQTFLKEVLI